jgi:RNA polymerase sporulation-specific sigma factor
VRTLHGACSDADISEWEGLCWSIAGKYFAPGIDLDDLVQEARIGVVEALRDYDGRGGLPQFVAMCIHREVQGAVTAAARIKHRPLNESARVIADEHGAPRPIVDHLEAPAGDVVDLVAYRERLAQTSRRIRERLSDIEYAALIGIANGEPYDVIASRVGADEKAVDNAAQRARHKLADDYYGGRRGVATGYDCPTCGGPTVKKRGRGRPRRCNVCRLGKAA